MNDLYLIGNGFDLAHGLKTSYNDFLLWYLKESIDKAELYTFEDDLLKIDGQNSSFVPSDSPTIPLLLDHSNRSGVSIGYKHDFFKKIVENYHDYKWVDIEYEYYMALVGLFKRLEKAGVSKSDLIDKELGLLNKCFASIKKKLVEYLGEHIKIRFEFRNDQMEDILFHGIFNEKGTRSEKETLFVCFNYTPTMQLYLNNTILENDIIYIHGK